jgi:putative ABC transport system ATP-binding protein
VTASSVVVRSVTKTYRRGLRQITALADVSFDLSPGEVALFVGPSGSGKTTLLNLIAALDRPDCGQIIIGEMEITSLSRSAAARYRDERIGFIFQSYNLLPQLTALENILLPMLPRRRWDRRRAVEILDAVGLSNRSSHRPAELSGGEQQRVAIARALVNDPAIILADEPTGNLDDDNARKIAELLSRTCRERGKTLILVTHDRQIIRPVNRVFDMRDGSLTMIESALPP